VDREAQFMVTPDLVTNATNRHLLQPTKIHKKRRRQEIHDIQAAVGKGKHRDSSASKASKPLLKNIGRGESSSSSSTKSKNSQLVDLVVEDTAAEEIDRVRARKEGGSEWNETDPKHFVRTYPSNHAEETFREGDEPGMVHPNQPHDPERIHDPDQALYQDYAHGGEGAQGDAQEGGAMWQHRRYDEDGEEADEAEDEAGASSSARYGSFPEERDVWSRRDEGGN
jgi:hypothetical protein